MPRTNLQTYAHTALQGVGDPSTGEWEEFTGYAFHLRRRLKRSEEAIVGPVVDIRGTAEAQMRMESVRMWIPPDWSE